MADCLAGIFGECIRRMEMRATRIRIRMEDRPEDATHEMMLDGNAAAGLLAEIFAEDMTAAPAECANCGRVGEVGTLLAFNQAPGLVLRCPTCQEVVLRVAQTPDATYLDARGAVYLRLARR
jgi:hypothetical protein